MESFVVNEMSQNIVTWRETRPTQSASAPVDFSFELLPKELKKQDFGKIFYYYRPTAQVQRMRTSIRYDQEDHDRSVIIITRPPHVKKRLYETSTADFLP